MAADALGAHAREDLGISDTMTARPVQAALTSALTFVTGATMPLLMVIVSRANVLVPAVSVTSLIFLALLGRIRDGADGWNWRCGGYAALAAAVGTQCGWRR